MTRPVLIPGPDSQSSQGLFEASLEKLLPALAASGFTAVVMSPQLLVSQMLREGAVHYCIPPVKELCAQILEQEQIRHVILWATSNPICRQFLRWMDDEDFPQVQILGHSGSALNLCLSDFRLFQLAQELKVPVPKSFVCESELELGEYCKRLQYPILASCIDLSVESRGVCNGPEEAEIYTQPILQMHGRVLIQEYSLNQRLLKIVFHGTSQGFRSLCALESLEGYNVREPQCIEYTPPHSFSASEVSQAEQYLALLTEVLPVRFPCTAIFVKGSFGLRLLGLEPLVGYTQLLALLELDPDQLQRVIFCALGGDEIWKQQKRTQISMIVPAWDSLSTEAVRSWEDLQEPVLLHGRDLPTVLLKAAQFLSRSALVGRLRVGCDFSVRELGLLNVPARRLLGVICCLQNGSSIAEVTAISGLDRNIVSLLKDTAAKLPLLGQPPLCEPEPIAGNVVLLPSATRVANELLPVIDHALEEMRIEYSRLGLTTVGTDLRLTMVARRGEADVLHSEFSMTCHNALEFSAEYLTAPILHRLRVLQQAGFLYGELLAVESVTGSPAVDSFPLWIVTSSSVTRVLNSLEFKQALQESDPALPMSLLTQKQAALEFHMDLVFSGQHIALSIVSQHLGCVDTLEGDTTLAHPPPQADPVLLQKMQDMALKLCILLKKPGQLGIHFAVTEQRELKIRNFWEGLSPYTMFHSRIAGASLVALGMRAKAGLHQNYQITPNARFHYVKAPLYPGGYRHRMPTGNVMGVGLEPEEALRMALVATGYPLIAKAVVLYLGNLDYLDDVTAILETLHYLDIPVFVSQSVREIYTIRTDLANKDAIVTEGDVQELLQSKAIDLLILPPANYSPAALSSYYRMQRLARHYKVASLNHLGLARRYVEAMIHGQPHLNQLAVPHRPLSKPEVEKSV